MSDKYVIIRISGKQYKLGEGEEFLVDKLGEEEPEAEVLLLVDDKTVTVGKPVLKEAKITLKVIGPEKGEKIDVIKYKSKSRYRRHTGFRAQLTRLQLVKIG